MKSTSIGDLFETYVAHLATRLRGVRTERDRLMRFIEWITARRVFDVRAVTRQHIEQYRADLLTIEYRRCDGMHKLGQRGRYDRLAVVQRFFAWLVANRLLIGDPSAGVKRGRRGAWQPATVLTEAEIAMLLEAPDASSLTGIRDRAVLELMYSTGLRRAEVVALDLADVDLTDLVVNVRSGKGDKQRLVPIGATAAEALINYLTKARPLFLKNASATALFLVGTRCGQTGRRLGAGSIANVVRAAARRSELGKHVTPHALRHTFATHLLRAGADVRHVQELLGHNRIDTTETYTHLDLSDLAQAHARAHPRGKERR